MRGVEIYGGRPILYSMGNFFFTNETRALVPPEAYEKQGLDPQTATVTDYGNAALGGGFGAHEQFWQAVLARVVLDGGRAELDLIPLTLSPHLPQHQRGLPQVASGEVGAAILDRIETLSSRYGTTSSRTRPASIHRDHPYQLARRNRARRTFQPLIGRTVHRRGSLTVSYDDIPAAELHQAKRLLFDTLGCALASRDCAAAQAVVASLDDLGGRPEATVLGTGERTSALNAILANGAIVRFLDLNDVQSSASLAKARSQQRDLPGAAGAG